MIPFFLLNTYSYSLSSFLLETFYRIEIMEDLRSLDDKMEILIDSLSLSSPSCLVCSRFMFRTSFLQRGQTGCALQRTTMAHRYRIHSSIHGRWKI